MPVTIPELVMLQPEAEELEKLEVNVVVRPSVVLVIVETGAA